ncbi:uncharacterized protein LOC110627990 isoform X1 [Manihot esculenta]|uniref:RPW8 domain-containing protein n=1 Tax=Manihot esculenta TaxID=3983 RepID=A0A2C9UV54_MANES|nr:uncharacterized protein LOC110627990 isoform X1 [Manihot esculenta]OAY35352.1 hypothetical protein MANES_12G094200v8 [Manihot esculenta]
MPMQHIGDVTQISMEIKYVKGRISQSEVVKQNSELKGIKEEFKTIEVANVLNVQKQLLIAVGDAKMKTEIYGSDLQGMESKLGSCIKKIEESNQVTYHVNEDLYNSWKQIIDGKQLVQMCASETSSCCCFKKPKYMNELQDLDNALERFWQQVVRPQEQESRKLRDTRAEAGQAEKPARVVHGRVEVKPDGDMRNSSEKKKETHVEGKSSGGTHDSNLTDRKINEVGTNSVPSVDDKERLFVPWQVVPTRREPEQPLVYPTGESGDSKLKQQWKEQTQKPIKAAVNDNNSVSSHSDGLAKQPKEKKKCKEAESSNPSEKIGLVLEDISSLWPSLPLKPPETKGLNDKFGSSGPTGSNYPLSNDDASSSRLLLSKPPAGREASKKVKMEVLKDGVSTDVSTASIVFEVNALAKEHFRNEVQDL